MPQPKGLITWKNFSLADRVEKSLDYKKYFSLGWNWSRKWTQAGYCLLPPAITWDFSARVAETGPKLSSCNCGLRFSCILSEGGTGISARAKNLHVINLQRNSSLIFTLRVRDLPIFGDMIKKISCKHWHFRCKYVRRPCHVQFKNWWISRLKMFS